MVVFVAQKKLTRDELACQELRPLPTAKTKEGQIIRSSICDIKSQWQAGPMQVRDLGFRLSLDPEYIDINSLEQSGNGDLTSALTNGSGRILTNTEARAQRLLDGYEDRFTQQFININPVKLMNQGMIDLNEKFREICAWSKHPKQETEEFIAEMFLDLNKVYMQGLKIIEESKAKLESLSFNSLRYNSYKGVDINPLLNFMERLIWGLDGICLQGNLAMKRDFNKVQTHLSSSEGYSVDLKSGLHNLIKSSRQLLDNQRAMLDKWYEKAYETYSNILSVFQGEESC